MTSQTSPTAAQLALIDKLFAQIGDADFEAQGREAIAATDAAGTWTRKAASAVIGKILIPRARSSR